MSRYWISNGSNTIAPIVNPLAAACRDGYVPTDVHLLTNPAIEAVTEDAASLVKTIVTAAGGEEPSVDIEPVEEETDFDAIIAYLNDRIAAARDVDAEIAVDVTPGRKFWSIISFQSGVTHDVDHLYYVHLDGAYFGECYPTIPRTAIDLIDFAEVLDAN